MEFRDLRPEEVECRVGSVAKDRRSLTVLLYKDARCDMAILDETVGTTRWQRDHKEIKGNLYCGVGIYDGHLDEWVWKWDCGTESYTEKEKGEASDSFKRACFNWGIGRELYTAPYIKLENGNGCKITDKGASLYAKVSKMVVSRKKITELELVSNGRVIYSWKSGETPKQPEAPKPEKKPVKVLLDSGPISDGGVDYLSNLIREANSDLDKILVYYKVKNLSEMTVAQFKHCCSVLEKR